jgi:integrin beta 3
VKAAALVPRPQDGRDAVVDIDAIVLKAAGLVPRPKDGKDADVDLDALAAKAAALIPRPRDGKDAEVDLDALALKTVALIPPPKDGQDAVVDLDALAAKAAALVPVPANGKDGVVDMHAVADLVAAEVRKSVGAIERPKDGQDGKDGKDGTSVDLATVQVIVDACVTKAIGTIPIPKDGKDGDHGKDVDESRVKSFIDDAVTSALAARPLPKDGVSIGETMLDRDGHLILTMTDGRTKDIGLIVGRDGQNVDLDFVKQTIATEVAKIERPKDGKDGRDGFGFDDIDSEFDEKTNTFALVFKRGYEKKSFVMPIWQDVGVYDIKASYKKGHNVGRDGSTWTALCDVPPGVIPDGKTELSRKHWRLSCKRGGEGKVGPRGPSPDEDSIVRRVVARIRGVDDDE